MPTKLTRPDLIICDDPLQEGKNPSLRTLRRIYEEAQLKSGPLDPTPIYGEDLLVLTDETPNQ